ncbi:MAG: hypothetical protein Sv326_0277 [Candidatus Fermentimicrarchaeum limneticum]|uniref:Big-1 domain-containing protein n=1 Tax=Fermentimicrarchaeum limneticum TaxID=2795018 RepID=A0A7D5XH46_FERL1|nr:MAG: hypothetical protein Sv326_0277 [Candidatus Fermentimicrarchaeum limneticum]
MKTIPIHLMRGRKAQTAVELLTVYGWVVLLILVVVIIMYSLGYLNLPNWLPPYCNITPTMSCRTYRFGYAPNGASMVLVYRIVNGLGYDILFPANSTTLEVENIGKIGKTQYNGTCYPIAYPIKAGTPLSCVIFIPDNDVIPDIGKNLDFRLTIRYRNCNAIPGYAKTGNCTGAPEYTVSGGIRTPMEPAVPTLYACGDGICDYVLGENPTNCCPDCPVSRLTLTADPNPVEQCQDTKLIATAFYPDGMFAEGATVIFDRTDGFKDTDLLIADDLAANSSVTNSSGEAKATYSSRVEGQVVLNASTCGPNATAIVVVQVNSSPPNGTVLFSWYPELAAAGSLYEVNVTVHNSSGNPVPSIGVMLRSDANSVVEPTTTVTDLNGVAHVNFSSNLTHVGRLVARTIGVWNSTNLLFVPSLGRLELWNNGPANVSSEGSIDISGCLYNTNDEPIRDTDVNLLTDFGYFISNIGTPKMTFPGSWGATTYFTTMRPTPLSNIPANWGYEVFGENKSYNTGDPIEIDAYAGKFVKIHMRSGYELHGAKLITDYLQLKGIDGTGERKIYLFYNTSYFTVNPNWGWSWKNPLLLYGNLTANLTSRGIQYTVISDPSQLRDLMLYHARESIIISVNGYFPKDIWACESNGGIPKIFFERGGIQIHTGDWEYYYALDLNDTYDGLLTCGESGGDWVFGWRTAGYYSHWVTPVKMNTSTTTKTYGDGCFTTATSHPLLRSSTPGIATIGASYLSISNSTLAEFGTKHCSDGTPDETCSSTKPLYCINGYLAKRCDMGCGCPDEDNQLCDTATGECVDKPAAIILTVRTFNGTGTQLPNDGYTRLQVIAQVYDQMGVLLNDVLVEWRSEGVLIPDVLCSRTTDYPPGCGDSSALPSPQHPRAAAYVTSNGSWFGTANITVNVTTGPYTFTNTTNITVYNNQGEVGNTRWREIGATLLPADNYTNTSLCFSTFGMNDSALGNVQVCFNSTRGTFGNGLSKQCLPSEEYGKLCAMLKSSTPGIANVTVNITNGTGSFIRYLPTNVTFYPIPTSIVINFSKNPVAPCAKCSTSSTVINATFRNATGAPIAGIPYVYFTIPYHRGAGDPYDWDQYPLVWRGSGYVETSWWQSWASLRPGWNPAYSNCDTVSGTPSQVTHTWCSNITLTDGSSYANFSPVYPPGLYAVNVSTWYRCTGEPFSPENCLSSVSSQSILNVSPIPQKIIIDPLPIIKPDYSDVVNATATVYGSDGNPLRSVFYYAEIYPMYTVSHTHNSAWWSDTNSSGRGVLLNIYSDVSGIFNLTFWSYYYNISGWVRVENSTLLVFGPNITTILIDASPKEAYADGVFVSNITITLLDSNGERMANAKLCIEPPSIGGVGCCDDSGCGCYNVRADGNGQYKTYIYSSTIGDANFSAHVHYGNGTDTPALYNSTNVTFKPPPAIATMTANPDTIDGDGVNRSLITARFMDSDNNPTPRISVRCNVSDDTVFFPTTGLVTDNNGEVRTNLSALSDPATIMCWYAGATLLVTSKNVTVALVTRPNNVRVNVTAEPATTTLGSKILVIANVTNYTTGEAMQTTPVSFNTSYGGVLENNLAVTNSSGLAAVNVTALGVGRIFVKANVSGDFGVVGIEYT